MQTEGEKNVERLLRDVGFGFVASNFVLQDYPAPIVVEVDLVFECGGAILIVEVSGGIPRIQSSRSAH